MTSIYLLLVAAILLAVFIIGKRGKQKTDKVEKLPQGNPVQFLQQGRKASTTTLVACAGDSLTHGMISANYVKGLEAELADSGYEFINAGLNGDLAYNLLRRIDTVIACKPDAVTILIGTNDINATLSPENEARYRRDKQIPETPTQQWYRENVAAIIDRLQSAGINRIAVLSLPMIGEDSDSSVNQLVRQYNITLQSLAEEKAISYLPLGEQLFAQLPTEPGCPPFETSISLMFKASARRFILRQSWNQISDAHGFHFLTDHIHVNDRARLVIENNICEFLREP